MTSGDAEPSGAVHAGAPCTCAALSVRAACRTLGFAFASVTLFAGCSRPMKPSESAHSRAASAPSTTVAGVTVRAKTDWRGESKVETFAIPVYIEIENGRRESLCIRYSRLWLLSDDGHTFEALPPPEVRRAVRAQLHAMDPHHRPGAPTSRPTRYLRQVALPEDCVRPGHELAGFAYFERVPPLKRRFTLNVEFVSAGSSRSLGVAQLAVCLD
jgi:hypothetical protein